MRSYIGKYRVVCEWSRDTLEPVKDDLHIVCSREGQIYRLDDNNLAYYRPSRGNSEQLAKKLVDLGVKNVDNRSTDGDLLIYFDEDSIDIVAKEVGASTYGAGVSPYSIRNLRKLNWFKKDINKYIELGLYEKPRELSEEEKEIFRQRFQKNING